LEVDLETAAAGTHYDADVCIAGAGIAGLVLADALNGSGLRVALLEAGGKTLEARSQQLYKVEMAGQLHTGASEGRYRTFGGSSTRWGGQLLSYPEDVFQPPPSTKMMGWPIGNKDVERFYPQVLRIMGVPENPFETSSFLDSTQTASASDELQVRYSRWAPFTRRSLAGTVGRRCVGSANVTVYFHANVTRLDREGDAVRTVHAANYGGKAYTFSARHIVVCLGTIESSRLLLLSDIGNENDQVGRYFHDHVGMHAATLQGTTRKAAAAIYLPKLNHGVLYTPKVEATEKWRSEHGANSVMAHFPIVEAEDSPTATIRTLLQSIQRKELAPGLLRRLVTLPAGSLDLLRLFYATRFLKRRALSKHAELRLNIDVEQRPAAESRVSLTDQKDELNLPMAKLDWRIAEAEARTARLFAHNIRAAFIARGVGDLPIHPALLKPDGDLGALFSDTYHMMGGTRMGETAAGSVVDSNLKVHGVENLYVASCSVFPTGGSSNPTFTLMALTLRLAEMLRGKP
jgi:choline dehydrogenase-like flavoprotein